jgi:hypothetical protein
MDKASPHYKLKKIQKYFEENKDTLIPIYLQYQHIRVYGDVMLCCITKPI